MLLAPVSCTLSLKELLQVRPHLWSKVADSLFAPNHRPPSRVCESTSFHNPQSTKSTTRMPLSIGKVSDPSDHVSGHTTLPVKYGGKESMAILDSGAGISIVTKRVWIKWEKPTVYKVCMSLQLADGSLNTALRLVEDIIVEFWWHSIFPHICHSRFW